MTSTDDSHQARWYRAGAASYAEFSEFFFEELSETSCSLEAAFYHARSIIYERNDDPMYTIDQFPLLYDFDEYIDWYL